MLEVAPSEVRAVVVGIDIYDYSAGWRLRGPADDARRTVDWLLAAGVDRKHVALFLSEPSWDTAEVQAWMAASGWTVKRNAREHDICSFFNRELHRLGGKALLLHWGGHGAVDETSRENCLFTADAVRDEPHCLSAQDMLRSLSDTRLGHLARQVFIFDICASPFKRIGASVLPDPKRLSKSGGVDLKVQQCALFASSLGQVAANISERGAGLFSELVFEQLKKTPTTTLAEFRKAFEAVRDLGAKNGLNAQRPRLQFKGVEDPELEIGNPMPADSRATLLALIHAGNPSPNLLCRIYLQALSTPRRGEPRHTIEAWLDELADSRPREPGYGAPLVEFAERLGRASGDAAYCAWARENAEPGPYAWVVQKLDAEQTADKRIATLFIEIESATAGTFQWWTEAPDPRHRSHKTRVTLDSTDLPAGLEARLPPILLEASNHLDELYRLRIGFIVPAALFSLGLESLKINWNGDIFRLDQQYPVLFHWHDRAVRKQPRYLTNWNDVLTTLGPRIQNGGNAAVQWLDAPTKANALSRYARASTQLKVSPVGAVCLGVGHPYSHGPDQSLETVVECLKTGVPCLFWLQLPRSPKKASEMRGRLATAFASVAPGTAPVAIWEGRRIASSHDQIAAIGMVWDVPAFLPANASIQPRFEEST